MIIVNKTHEENFKVEQLLQQPFQKGALIIVQFFGWK